MKMKISVNRIYEEGTFLDNEYEQNTAFANI